MIESHTNRLLRLYSDALGGLVLVVGLGVLFGWFFDVGVLKSLLPGRVEMKFNTAIGFFLAGLALLGATPWHEQRYRTLGRASALLVVALGAITLAEYVFGWEAGLDNFFFRESPGAVGTSSPGRMAPQSAASFVLFGLASRLSSVPSGWRRTVSQVMLAGVALIALAALAGHLYGALYLYGLSQFTGMAIHTALAFLALCVGLFLAYHVDGTNTIFFSDTSGGVTARRLLPAAILSPLLLGWLRVRGQVNGLYDTAAGAALLVTANILVFAVLIGLTVRVLHRLDLSRRDAQQARDRTITELQQALDEVRTLRGLLPMCAWCKKIRDDGGFWNEVSAYISAHTHADVSHGICPECAKGKFGDSGDA